MNAGRETLMAVAFVSAAAFEAQDAIETALNKTKMKRDLNAIVLGEEKRNKILVVLSESIYPFTQTAKIWRASKIQYKIQ